MTECLIDKQCSIPKVPTLEYCHKWKGKQAEGKGHSKAVYYSRDVAFPICTVYNS